MPNSVSGCELEFTNDSNWAIPCLHEWEEAGRIHLSDDSLYWKKVIEYTDALLELGRDAFYTGFADIPHAGADALAAFRDPEVLCTDLIDYPGQVKRLLDHINRIYFRVYDFYYGKLTAAGQPVALSLDIVSSRKWGILCNDFSCMISKAMFDEFFLPGLQAEAAHYECSIYHLDGVRFHCPYLFGVAMMDIGDCSYYPNRYTYWRFARRLDRRRRCMVRLHPNLGKFKSSFGMNLVAPARDPL